MLERYDAGMTEALLYWGLALLAVSLILVVVEAFVPSAGALALVSLTLAVVGLVCLFRFDWRWGMVGVLAVIVLGPAAFFMALNVFPSTPLGRKIINSSSSDEDGPPAAETELAALVDTEAEAATDLRPGGFVRVAGKRIAATSDVSFVAAGTRVRVVGEDGMQLRVRPVG